MKAPNNPNEAPLFHSSQKQQVIASGGRMSETATTTHCVQHSAGRFKDTHRMWHSMKKKER